MAYARERGGDARRLVVASARVRALAEKWGVGRLLEPAAIRALLDQKTAGGDDGTAGTLKCSTAMETCTTLYGTEVVRKRYGIGTGSVRKQEGTDTGLNFLMSNVMAQQRVEHSSMNRKAR